MTFEEHLKEALALLERQGRVSYRALKRHLGVDDAYVADLRAEIVDVLRLAVDHEGTMLVWHRASKPSAPPAAGPPPHQAGGERRQLTVMLCDLVESTALAARLDPEDFRDLVRAYQAAAGEVIQRFGGHVAQYLGDGILVYFGFPVAHDDDGVRAVRAALEIVEAMKRLNARLTSTQGLALGLRIGLHTGPIVISQIGSGERREVLAVGEAPNVASRVQGLAPVNGVVVSEATWRIVSGYFVAEDLGEHTLKGVVEPVAIHRVVSESGARTRLEAARSSGLTPLVGRESELRVVRERWELCARGEGHVVLLSGEPGIGKSRVADAFEAEIAGQDAARLGFRCSPYHANSALYPVSDHVERSLDLRSTDPADVKLAKLEEAFLAHRGVGQRGLPLVASLLSLPVPEGRYPAIPAVPDLLKQQTMETLKGWMIEEARARPLLVVFEDLHWADPSTLELLGQLMEALPTTRILLLVTTRPIFTPAWIDRPGVTALSLGRLPRTQTESMIHALTRGKALPADVIDVVVAKTDGVPLFTEELLKTILESELLREEGDHYDLVRPLPTLSIPTTLQDSLMARLDRLNGAKEIAQIGATVGREFSHEMLCEVAEKSPAVIARELARLVDAGLVAVQGAPPAATYVFKHALIRDVAYESLLRSRRRDYHKRIAETLDARHAGVRETQPELLAYHYTEAKIPGPAVAFWLRAGQREIQRSANVEAIAYLTKGLEAAAELPEGAERRQRELALRVALAVPLIATKGYAASEVESTYARARELSLQVGESPELPNIVWGMWVYYLTGGPIRSALALAEQYRALAERLQQEELRLETCQVMGIAQFYMGQFADAREYLERGRRLYDPARHHALVFAHGGADTGVALHTHAALTLWTLGFPDQAHAAMRAAIETAESLGHPFSLAFARYFCAWLHQLCHDDERVRESASAAVAICDQHGFPFWGLVSAALHGSTQAGTSAAAEGIAAIRKSLASYEASGAALYRPELLGLLATTLAKTGHAEQGLEVLPQAFAAMSQSDERWWHAELHRLRGELTRALPGDHAREAEAAFRQALEIARAQGARSWELRAATSLAKLLQGTPREAEGRATLAAVHDGFTEGFGTADLREAATLLARPPPVASP